MDVWLDCYKGWEKSKVLETTPATQRVIDWNRAQFERQGGVGMGQTSGSSMASYCSANTLDVPRGTNSGGG